jgi:hypothetical protein
LIEETRIRVALVVGTELTHPILGLARVYDGEDLVGVKVGPPLVVQDTEVVGLDSLDHVGLVRRKVGSGLRSCSFTIIAR